MNAPGGDLMRKAFEIYHSALMNTIIRDWLKQSNDNERL
jgi:hypothetical protein